jgi:NADH-quinone oxidoreductase subunit C
VAVRDAVAALQEEFPDLDLKACPLVRYGDGRDSGQLFVVAPPERLIDILSFLKRDPRCLFEQLCDVTCVDYLNFPHAEDRFGVIYSLLSLTHNQRLWVKAYVNDPRPTLPSATAVWKGANWTEREVYDMFGIRFEGHPDLRRILLPDGFVDHPLRKDYPLRGRGEREAFPVVTRESA